MISVIRKFYTTTSALKAESINRQVKIFQKLLGQRQKGSKKRWYPTITEDSPQLTTAPQLITKTKNVGKNASRRVSVLNKLFMRNITDLMATGDMSEKLLGKGLEISRVKMSPDFQNVQVYWIAKGDNADEEIESTLLKCAGAIRHELSQLRLMGEVPKILFIKDKSYAKMTDVENILQHCDFGEDFHPQNLTDKLKDELHLETFEIRDKFENRNDEEELFPEMRHDIFGLDHKSILNTILAKMKKSQDAWEIYDKNLQNTDKQNGEEVRIANYMNMSKTPNEDFKKFLRERNFRKITPDRKKYYDVNQELFDHNNILESYENIDKKDEDLWEDIENEKR